MSSSWKAGSPSCRKRRSRLLTPGIHPQERSDGFCVGDAAVAHHGDGLGEGHEQRLDELAGIEGRVAYLAQFARDENVDRLVGVRNRGMDYGEVSPLLGGVA